MAAVSQAFYTLTIVSPSERVVRNSHFYGLESSIKRCTKKAVIYSDVKLNWVLQQGITGGPTDGQQDHKCDSHEGIVGGWKF